MTTCRLTPHLFLIFSRCNKSCVLEKKKTSLSAASSLPVSPTETWICPRLLNTHALCLNLTSSTVQQKLLNTSPICLPSTPVSLPDPGHGRWQWANNWSAGDPSGLTPTSPTASQLILSVHSWCHSLLEIYARSLVTWEKVPSADHTLRNEAEFVLAPGYYNLSHYPSELPYPQKGCVLPLHIQGFLHLGYSGPPDIIPATLPTPPNTRPLTPSPGPG